MTTDEIKVLRERLASLRTIQFKIAQQGATNPHINGLILDTERQLEDALAVQDREEAESYGLGFSLMDWLILAGIVAALLGGIAKAFHIL